MDNLFTVGLPGESKKMVRAQLNDIFGEKIARLKKETDEEIKRVRKEGNGWRYHTRFRLSWSSPSSYS